MNDSPVDCQNVKLPTATFVTRVEARPSATSKNKQNPTYIKPTGSKKEGNLRFGLIFMEKCKKTIDKYNKSGYNI